MGSSFVLRDRGGRPAGYVMQGMGVVRCRASTLAQPAQLVLLRAGEAECRPMPADGQEQIWPDGGRALTGAYIASDGALLLDTGEAARLAFERVRRRTAALPDARARQPEKTMQTEKRTAEQPEETVRPAQEQASKEIPQALREAMPQTRSLPQRRWPPPPCWQEARYIDGQWQTPGHHESG